MSLKYFAHFYQIMLSQSNVVAFFIGLNLGGTPDARAPKLMVKILTSRKGSFLWNASDTEWLLISFET